MSQNFQNIGLKCDKFLIQRLIIISYINTKSFSKCAWAVKNNDLMMIEIFLGLILFRKKTSTVLYHLNHFIRFKKDMRGRIKNILFRYDFLAK